MPKISDENGFEDEVLTKRNHDNRVDEENGNGNKERNRNRNTTGLSSKIYGGSSTISSSSNSSSSKKRPFVRIIVTIATLFLCVATLGFILVYVYYPEDGNLRKESNDTIASISVGAIPDSNEDIPTSTPTAMATAFDIEVVTVTETKSVDGFEEGEELKLSEFHGSHKRRLQNEEPYSESCDPCRYYDSIANWTRAELQSLLQSTQLSLNYSPDTWEALKDVDRGDEDESGTVRMIYTNQTISSSKQVTSDGIQEDRWNREHMWPRGRGVGKSGPANSDVHHLFPSDPKTNSDARGRRYFDYCIDTENCKDWNGLSEPNSFVYEQDNDGIFQPPEEVRGIVARAILYVDLRYEDLELTDESDPNQRNENGDLFRMGKLSTLLEWHNQYKPTPAELQRNNRVCSNWQGNRNPFVDFPGLVDIIYGESTFLDSDNPVLRNCGSSTPIVNDQALGLPSSSTPSSNDINSSDITNSSTNMPSNNTSSTLPPTDDKITSLPSPGDVMIVGVHSDNPDVVALIALEALPSGLVIHVTDNEYNGASASFGSNEGTLSLTLPETIPAGTVFGYGDGEGLLYESSWYTMGPFDLSVSGDTIIVYTGTETNPTILSVVSFAGRGLPDSITTEFAVDLGNQDNYVYTGPMDTNKATLQKGLVDRDNWRGSNSKTDVSVSQWKALNEDGFNLMQTAGESSPSTDAVSSVSSSDGLGLIEWWMEGGTV